MFCTKCGKEIPNDSKVCGYCGVLVENDSSQPDDKFNVVAGLFPFPWALIKGMWDFALVIGVIHLLLVAIPVLGWVARIVIAFVEFILVGRNANYYYWLKTTKNISFWKAVRDVGLRRI